MAEKWLTDLLPHNAATEVDSHSGQRSTLQGAVGRITYQSAESRYTVARLEVEGSPPVTIVGVIYPVREGEEIKVSGFWSHHPRYGLQFKVEQWEKVQPVTLEGIEKYLGSGLIKGIGPAFARRLVAAFGIDTLTVLSREPRRLLEVPGIGPERARRITEVWNEHEEMREILVFLQGHGLTSHLALKIYRAYGRETVAKVKENPYQMAEEIYGIGFLLADRVAQHFGIRRDSPYRTRAGILHGLQKSVEAGHCYVPLEAFRNHVTSLLHVDEEAVADGIRTMANLGLIVLESQADESFPRVYSRGLYEAERRVASAIRRLAKGAPLFLPADGSELLEQIQSKLRLVLEEEQRQALLQALRSKVLIITGGPGTGKTTLLTYLLALFRSLQVAFALAAPTGRAAKRMEEATGEAAKTIHRLLEYNPRDGTFHHNGENPIEVDAVIIDEASMIDLPLMDHLLRALDSKTRLILLGDVDQLPSVGPGNVLRDLIDSRAVPVTTLKHVFRQAAESLIVVNAHRILQGKPPVLADRSRGQDFIFIERDSQEEILDTLKGLVKQSAAAQPGNFALQGLQVLTPTHRGILGTVHLNRELQELLNPKGEGLERGTARLRLGDRVMQLRNDYEKGVFNGDLGRIVKVDREEGKLIVQFDTLPVTYEAEEMDELTLAYATSVHKSQGSEYPAVVVLLHTSHYLMLHRSILYTAITRGKEQVVLVGSKKAVVLATKNARVQRRYTGLQERLKLGETILE